MDDHLNDEKRPPDSSSILSIKPCFFTMVLLVVSKQDHEFIVEAKTTTPVDEVTRCDLIGCIFLSETTTHSSVGFDRAGR